MAPSDPTPPKKLPSHVVEARSNELRTWLKKMGHLEDHIRESKILANNTKTTLIVPFEIKKPQTQKPINMKTMGAGNE